MFFFFDFVAFVIIFMLKRTINGSNEMINQFGMFNNMNLQDLDDRYNNNNLKNNTWTILEQLISKITTGWS